MERSSLLGAFNEAVKKRKDSTRSWDESEGYWYEVFVMFGPEDSTKTLFSARTSASLINMLISEKWYKNDIDKNGNFIVYEDGKEHKAKGFGVDLWRNNEQYGPELFKILVL